MAEVKTIREADNKVSIVGWLKEKNLEFKTQEAKGSEDAYDYVTGSLSIETGKNQNHMIHFFQKALTKVGKENAFYKGLKTIDSEYISIASYLAENSSADVDEARDNASKVFCTGSLVENIYTDENGKLITNSRIRGINCSRIKDETKFEPHATFKAEIFIDKLSKEIIKEEETGRAIIEGIIVGYEGNISCIKFIAPKKYDGISIASYILENYKINDTVLIEGHIISLREEVEKPKTKSFGVQVHNDTAVRFINELQITAGSPEGYDRDSDNAYGKELITKLKAKRETSIEERQNKGNTTTSSTTNTGFGKKTATDEVKAKAKSFEF